MLPETARPREGALRLFLGIQATALLVVVFVPFGFDHPSSWGLDFDDFLLVALVYLAALLAGLVLSVRLRRWWLMAAELALGALVVLLELTGTIAA